MALVRSHHLVRKETVLKSRIVILGFVSALLMVVGCTSEETQQVRTAQLGTAPADDDFAVSVTLCRKVGRKTGRRIGAGREFTMSTKSYVKAFADFQNAQADRPYTVHLVWIRPDGREMFRKYADVRQAVLGPQEYRTVITWLDAEDLHKVSADTVLSAEPSFSLPSQLNISQKKARTAGDYLFRVYLDRRLLLAEPFTVRASD